MAPHPDRRRCALLFGGPGPERDISAGSIKPWVTYLFGDPGTELVVVFFDRERRAYVLPRRFHFTNTCDDFASELSADDALDEPALDALLARQDVVVPILHGALGEDGEIQQRLERLDVPYLFSRPDALAASFDKAETYRRLSAAGLPTPDHFTITAEEWPACASESFARARERFTTCEVGGRPRCCVVKPARSGSSYGVTLVEDDSHAFAQAVELAFEHDTRVLVEPILTGSEFSVLVVDGGYGRPRALAPTEIEKRSHVYDTRAKYLHGEGAALHTPLRDASRIDAVRAAAVAAYDALGMRHMARLDGFFTSDDVHVTDVNGISGMGFSSFVFLQTSMVGASHAELIGSLVERVARPRTRARDVGGTAVAVTPAAAPASAFAENVAGASAATELGAPFPPVLGSTAVFPGPSTGRPPPRLDALPALAAPPVTAGRMRIHLLLGGATSERQVSRQSGIFAGLCLMAQGHDVRFVFLDTSYAFTEIGLFYALHHDVEEIEQLVRDPGRRAQIAALAHELGPLGPSAPDRHLHVGRPTDLAGAVAGADLVFLALHGGLGEDGTIQAALDRLRVPYNGCGAAASRLCSDKWRSLEAVRALDIPGVAIPAHEVVMRAEMEAWLVRLIDDSEWDAFVANACARLGAEAIVCKPRADGCSTGVKLVRDGRDLRVLFEAIVEMRESVPAGAFGPGSREVKLPQPAPEQWLFEQALVDPCDLAAGAARPPAGSREWFGARRWIELTCGVVELDDGTLAAGTPSVCLAEGHELSLEEKFQQGVGTNLLLSAFLPEERVAAVRERVAAIANGLGLAGFARIDCFYDRDTDAVVVLEINTLCALTEATVFYTQMLDAFGWGPPEVLDHVARVGRARAGPVAG